MKSSYLQKALELKGSRAPLLPGVNPNGIGHRSFLGKPGKPQAAKRYGNFSAVLSNMKNLARKAFDFISLHGGWKPKRLLKRP